MDDEKLLRLLHKDPNTGMEKLIEIYAGLVYAVITRAIPDSCSFTSELESCVADVFSEFYCNLSKYDPRLSSIKTYLCVIARNNAIDLLRKNDKLKSNISLDTEDLVLTLPGSMSAEDTLLKKETRREILQAINAMGEPDRSILLRKFYFLQPSKQIAADLGLTSSNVDTRTHRALHKLRRLFEVRTNEKNSL